MAGSPCNGGREVVPVGVVEVVVVVVYLVVVVDLVVVVEANAVVVKIWSS